MISKQVATVRAQVRVQRRSTKQVEVVSRWVRMLSWVGSSWKHAAPSRKHSDSRWKQAGSSRKQAEFNVINTIRVLSKQIRVASWQVQVASNPVPVASRRLRIVSRHVRVVSR